MRTVGILFGTILTVFAGYFLMYSTGKNETGQKALIQLDGNQLVKAPILGTNVSGFPDKDLVDQDGESVQVEDLKGKRTLISFIYTSCPDAQMCPLITEKMREIQSDLEGDARDRVQFVSVTFDPETDTPKTLKHYGKQKNVNFANWSFWTGPTETINALMDRFGITAKSETGNDTMPHNMRTYIVDRDLKIQHAWRGSKWSEQDVAEALRP
jgi:protein SCO1/2